MKIYYFLLLSCFVVSAISVPSTAYAVHERRDGGSASRWIQRDIKVNQQSIIPISIALAQQNLESGYEFLMDVSHPDSPNYGKHWSAEKVNSFKFKFSNSDLMISGRKHIFCYRHGHF